MQNDDDPENIQKFGRILNFIFKSGLLIALVIGLDHHYSDKPESTIMRVSYLMFFSIFAKVSRYFYFLDDKWCIRPFHHKVHLLFRKHAPVILIAVMQFLATEAMI